MRNDCLAVHNKERCHPERSVAESKDPLRNDAKPHKFHGKILRLTSFAQDDIRFLYC